MPRVAAVLMASMLATVICPASAAAEDTETRYYVGCQNAADHHAGTSPEAPWRSLARANEATLQPGDWLLLQRGCVWTGELLNASWTGSAERVIYIGSFGDLDIPRPIIANGGWTNVRISGSYLHLFSLDVRHDPVRFASCGQPLGTYYGFAFIEGAHHNTLKSSRASQEMTGILLDQSSSYNIVTSNELTGNNVTQTFGAGDDLGAIGLTLNGHHQEVSYNTFDNNQSVCRNENGRFYSHSVELYAARYNEIHHNRSNDRVFSELGSSAAITSTDNVFAYNLFNSQMAQGRFITTRGADDGAYGPVWSTRLEHNTIYVTGHDAQGVVCVLGCSAAVLSARGNIIFAETKVIYADAPFDEADNILWNSAGDPTVQIEEVTRGGLVRYEASPTDLVADPRFANPDGSDFELRGASPAVDRSSTPPRYSTDLANVLVPQGDRPDTGAFELPQ